MKKLSIYLLLLFIFSCNSKEVDCPQSSIFEYQATVINSSSTKVKFTFAVLTFFDGGEEGGGWDFTLEPNDSVQIDSDFIIRFSVDCDGMIMGGKGFILCQNPNCQSVMINYLNGIDTLSVVKNQNMLRAIFNDK